MLKEFRSNVKIYWHEVNAFFSALKILLTGDVSERKAVEGGLFRRKFLLDKYFVNKLKRQKIAIADDGRFKRVQIGQNVIYWPSNANIESLFVVLAEALFEDHPHYYDTGTTVIKKGDRVLDIGACEGAFSLSALQKGALVTAVEPSKTMIDAMMLSVNDLNLTGIQFVACILGAENKVVGFKENITSPEASMICQLSETADHRECWTLDLFVEKYFPGGIDYIKCDAEGHDFDILKSGLGVLRKYKPRIAVASYHTQYDFKKIKALLEGVGYTVTAQGLYYSPVLHKCYPMLLKAY